MIVYTWTTLSIDKNVLFSKWALSYAISWSTLYFPLNPSFGPSSRPRNRSRNLLPSRMLKPNGSNKVRLQYYGIKYRDECSCRTWALGLLIFFTVKCMSKKSWPILYSNLLYKLGQYFLYILYTRHQKLPWEYFSCQVFFDIKQIQFFGQTASPSRRKSALAQTQPMK